jgi:raffinose/stachyose/melibiose transport system permease protein
MKEIYPVAPKPGSTESDPLVISQQNEFVAASFNRKSLVMRILRSWPFYLLLLPLFIGMFIFQYYPAFTAFYRSFYAWDGRRAVYVGLNNFDFFLKDPQLLASWVNIGQLLAFALVVIVTIPLMTAYLIFRLPNPRHQYIYRVIFVIPIIVPNIVLIIVWRWFFSLNGAVNVLLRSFGLDHLTRLWLGNSETALYALMFVGFPWAGGIGMLLYLAGFMAIPREILDAAAVDGATGLRRFWSVELPLIRGQIKLQLILTLIAGLQQFDKILIMTNGGPGWATMVPGLRMYHAATRQFDLGYASSIGLVLFVVIFILTMINQRIIRGGSDLY